VQTGNIYNHKQFLLLLRFFQNMLSDWEGERMPVFEGKYDFVEAGNFDRSYTNLDWKLRTSEFIEIARPFVASTNRLLSFYEWPLQLIFWSGIMGQVKMLGRYHAGIDPEDDSRDAEPAVQTSIMDHYTRVTGNGNPNAQKVLAHSSKILGGMTGDGGMPGIPPACEGVEAALAAMTMSAYATFETLASDLWICILNKHTSLADNWADKNKDKQLTMKDISGHGWDLSKAVGSALHITGKISFQTLKEIRMAYSQAFKGEIDSIFDGSPELVKSEKIRHLFAHRGGLVDRKFKDEMSNFDDCKNVVIGERLRLTGPVTGQLINACIGTGTSLLWAADEWSQTHL
jgi:hypothetical protein